MTKKSVIVRHEVPEQSHPSNDKIAKMLQDLIIYQKTYDFMLRLHPVVNKFPKSQRFVLGQRIENKTLDLLHSMIVANAERDKSTMLRMASVELDELRILIRLAKDLRFVNIKQYEIMAERMNEIGKLLYGWMNKFPRAA
ncbi:MAG: diversity-generating retroelement protein Avd [bacterium]|nr:diversity-generating retroelement protein Avd [bacterium]